jgi:hypothetical protein
MAPQCCGRAAKSRSWSRKHRLAVEIPLKVFGQFSCGLVSVIPPSHGFADYKTQSLGNAAIYLVWCGWISGENLSNKVTTVFSVKRRLKRGQLV